ncbi:MAG: hypothetical protein AB7O26_10095 [Planctomycetaceae bacterium]
MLLKTSIGISIFSLVLFSWLAISGAKGPTFNTGGGAGSTSGGRGTGGSGWIWHGGK